MVPLCRGPEPEILVEKGAAWTAKYLQRRATDPKLRPLKEQYRHPDVLRALQRMSHRKCFYCERALADGEQKIDHYIEVAERPDLAFRWINLYYARALRQFDRTLMEILRRMALEQRGELSAEELALLRAWAEPVRPFSKMIADRLRAAGL